MGKKKMNYRCSCCGFECEKEDQLLQHCAKVHPNDHDLPYKMVGKFATLEQANIAFGKLMMDNQILIHKVQTLENDKKSQHAELLRLSKAINIYNEAAKSITSTMSLLSSSLEPYREANQNESH
jgi:hypothetical protein